MIMIMIMITKKLMNFMKHYLIIMILLDSANIDNTTKGRIYSEASKNNKELNQKLV